MSTKAREEKEEAALVANQHNAPRASPICFRVNLAPNALTSSEYEPLYGLVRPSSLWLGLQFRYGWGVVRRVQGKGGIVQDLGSIQTKTQSGRVSSSCQVSIIIDGFLGFVLMKNDS
jgi:hypothetical protein